jgi:hypothetical protein
LPVADIPVTKTLDIGTTLPSVKRRRARVGDGSFAPMDKCGRLSSAQQ